MQSCQEHLVPYKPRDRKDLFAAFIVLQKSNKVLWKPQPSNLTNNGDKTIEKWTPCTYLYFSVHGRVDFPHHNAKCLFN